MSLIRKLCCAYTKETSSDESYQRSDGNLIFRFLGYKPFDAAVLASQPRRCKAAWPLHLRVSTCGPILWKFQRYAYQGCVRRFSSAPAATRP